MEHESPGMFFSEGKGGVLKGALVSDPIITKAAASESCGVWLELSGLRAIQASRCLFLSQ